MVSNSLSYLDEAHHGSPPALVRELCVELWRHFLDFRQEMARHGWEVVVLVVVAASGRCG